MKRKFVIWLSLWLCLIPLWSSCGLSGSDDRRLATAEQVASRQPLDRYLLRAEAPTTTTTPPPPPTAPPTTAPKPRVVKDAVSRGTKRSAVPAGSGTASLAQLDALAGCESGMDPNKNTGNGFVNAFQYVRSTWDGLVRRLKRFDLVGNYFPSYDTQRWVTQHIPISAWPDTAKRRGQFPGCFRKLRAAGIV